MSWILFKLDEDNNKSYFEQVSGNQVRLSDNILRANQYDDECWAKQVKLYLRKTFDVTFDGVEQFEFNYGNNLKKEKMKIKIDGEYKTRKGADVQIYKVFKENGSNLCLVHGAVFSADCWVLCSWTLEGKYNPNSSTNSEFDLFELNPLYDDFKIDDLVIVWNHHREESHVGYFSGTTEEGKPTVWAGGRTSYTGHTRAAYLNCIKYSDRLF